MTGIEPAPAIQGPVLVRRVSPAFPEPVRVDQLREVLKDAAHFGLGNDASVRISRFYEERWLLQFHIEGEVHQRPICPECRAGKHAVCSNLAADVDGEPTECECDHATA